MRKSHIFTSELVLQIFAFVMLCIVAGCSSNYKAQPINLPTNVLNDIWEDAGNDPLIEYTAILPEDWWNLFNDEQLSTFILTAFARNPTLQKARTNILQAYYTANRIRSILSPNINFGADVLREKLSETGIIPFNTTGQVTGQPPLVAPGGFLGIPVYFTQYETEFTLNYDFDIWGKNRSTLKAALGEVQTNIADETFKRLQLGIAVAQTYFKLQIYYKRQEIALEQVSIKERLLAFNQQRLQGHLENDFNIISGEASLASSRQALYQIQGAIAVAEYQLKAYLAGDFEEEIYNTKVVEQPLPKVPLPIDIPLHLIAHRPDIIAQIWVIESAGHLIDAAKAGFYPDFSLSALFGFQTIHLHELFKWPSSFFNVDPAVSLPIFDGGRLIANLRGSEVNYNLAIYEYNRLVLNAAMEVLEGIAVLRNNEQQLGEYKKITAQNDQNIQLITLRAENNLASDMDKLISESNLLAARDQEIVALGETLQSVLLLIKALGGGYEACYE